jgi:hypothetical protein
MAINGIDGDVWFGALGRKLKFGLTMKEFGDSVGVCLNNQYKDEIYEELAEVAMEEFIKK